jgi:hypothetical protein
MYNCFYCDYNTVYKSHYDKHLLTKKHIANSKKKYNCDNCHLLHDSKTNKGSFHALMTGTDKELFSPLDGHASFFHAAPSFIQKG